MHRVVVIFGISRIDGHEWQFAPILAAFERRGTCCFRFGHHRAAKDIRDAVSVDGDQADRPLVLKRTKPLHDLAGRQTELAVASDFDRDKIAVFRAAGVGGSDGSLAAKLFLVDRNEPPAAVWQAAKNAEHAMLSAVDEFYDAAARLLLICLFDAQQGTIADTRNFSGSRAARHGKMDDWRRPVRVFVPFSRSRQQFTVAVATGDVGEDDGRQRAGVMQALSALFDVPAVGEFAQHLLERSAVGILGAERAGYLARADLAGVLANKSQKLFARRKGGGFHGPLIGRIRGRARRFGLFGSLGGFPWWFSGCGSFRGSCAWSFGRSFDVPRGAWRRAFRLARPRVGSRAVAVGSGIDESGRLCKRDALRGFVGRQCRVDAVVADVRPVAAVLGRDRAAPGRMVAERAPGVGAETAAGALGNLFRDQRHGAVEADVKDIVAGLEIGVGFAVVHVRSEPADGRADRLAVFRMAADFAGQRQQHQRPLKVDFVRRCAFRQSGALWLFALDGFAELHIGAEAPSAQRDFKTGRGIFAELLGANEPRAVGRCRQRAGVAAFGIVRTADEGPELGEL